MTNKSPASDVIPYLGIPSSLIIIISPGYVISPILRYIITSWPSKWIILISKPKRAYFNVIFIDVLRSSPTLSNLSWDNYWSLNITSPALWSTNSSAASLNLSSCPSGEPFSI